MAGSGVNLATTRDGGSYNKLQRPENYLMSSITVPPPAKAQLTDALSSTHASKRKREQDSDISRNQRVRLGKDAAEMEKPRPGNTNKERQRGTDCGMRTMLPGLDDEGNSSDEGIGEALAYLRDVRSEASAIPHLLVGNTTHGRNDTEHDQHVIFREGTCIAVDEHPAVHFHSQDSEEEELSTVDPQDRLYELLLKRFYRLRETLATAAEETQTPDTQRRQAQTKETRCIPRSERAWSDTISQEHPNLAQVVQLDSVAVYFGLRSCAGSIDQASSISSQVSCWIWTLLASVGDVGTLDNEKISRIRDLGLKAGLMGCRLRMVDGKGAETKPDHILQDSTCDKTSRDDVVAARDGHGAQEQDHTPKDIGREEPESHVRSEVAHDDMSESDAEMSMSGDEGQVHDVEASELDRARARLLSQLGDRLVHAQPPPSATSPKTFKKNSRSSNVQQDQGKRTEGPKSKSGIGHAKNNDVFDRRLGGLASYGVDFNTQATIDMILTVVAECFGQRDLLRYRQQW